MLAALVGRPRLDRMLPGSDVVWLPAPRPVALSSHVPVVLTVHDLSFEHRPADFGTYERAWHRLARPAQLARRANRVIAVSAAVRSELVAEWGLDPGRVARRWARGWARLPAAEATPVGAGHDADSRARPRPPLCSARDG